ncbi:AAA family ATPase [Tundrisphaera lichenicola]|uniref:AAA family ATPase n=1 Tax=Tundrisphaera lichenicola TaxID=2029860 RepID=UPI003EC0B4C7
MQAYVISDDDEIGRAARQILIKEGIDCPRSSLIEYYQAKLRLDSDPAQLIVAVLPLDPIRSVEALEIIGSISQEHHPLVIAVGPAADTKLVIRALRGIVDDYVDVDDMEVELIEALTSWQLRRVADKPEGRLIAILGPNGGAGSSTIAANLGVLIAKEQKSAALVDLKLETGDLASLLDLKPTHSLADLSRNIDRLDQVFFERALAEHPGGVRLLSPPKSLADIEMVTPEGVLRSVGMARSLFPYVLVDMDHNVRAEQLQILRQADLVLVVFRLDFTSLRNVNRFLDHFDGLGIPMDKIRLVVNRSGQFKEVPPAKAEEALNTKIFHLLPDDPKATNRATNHGVPVVLDAPSSWISKSLVKLAQQIQTPAAGGAVPQPSSPGKAKLPLRRSTAPRGDLIGRL